MKISTIVMLLDQMGSEIPINEQICTVLFFRRMVVYTVQFGNLSSVRRKRIGKMFMLMMTVFWDVEIYLRLVRQS